ncbi:MAG: SpoIIE family protein phosphatase [Actinomycetota bacterium]
MVGWSGIGDDDRLRLLEAALEQTRASACITDAALDEPGPRILYVNPAYCAMTGRDRDSVVGRTPRIMQGPLTDRGELDRLRADLGAGRPFVGETINYRADGMPFEISWRIDPIVDSSGRITNFVATQQDVTTVRRAERLLAAERMLDQTLTDVLGDPSGTIADVRCVVDAIVEALSVVVPLGAPGVELTVRTADGPERLTGGVETSRPASVADELLELDAGDGTATLLLPIDGEQAGIAGFVSVSGVRAWERDAVDLDGLRQLAVRIRLVVEAALEYERRRAAALELQRALLPVVPELADLAIAARYVPVGFGADVGGDFYDVVDTDEATFVVVGDVAGSGLRIAADMGRLVPVLRAELTRHRDAGRALDAADQLCFADRLFATAAIVTVDRDRSVAEVRSAGHPPPILRRPDGATAAVIDVGPPLGAGVGGWSATNELLGPGSALALYTDGLVERRDLDAVDGIELLRCALDEAPDDLEAACDHVVDELTSQHPLADDAALVVIAPR